MSVKFAADDRPVPRKSSPANKAYGHKSDGISITLPWFEAKDACCHLGDASSKTARRPRDGQ